MNADYTAETQRHGGMLLKISRAICFGAVGPGALAGADFSVPEIDVAWAPSPAKNGGTFF
jgi:hypothetical protein